MLKGNSIQKKYTALMLVSVLVVMVTGCTFMAFVSVSGDFCQAQHLVIVDK